MSDSASLVTYVMLHNQQVLDEQRDRAGYLAKKTGQEPISWYEFSQSNPAPKRSFAQRITVGAAIGAAVGIVAKLIASKYFPNLGAMGTTGIIGGTSAVGGLVGGLSAVEEKGPRQDLINKYKLYLDDFEKTVSRQQSQSQSVVEAEVVPSSDHLGRVQASRQSAAKGNPLPSR